MVKARGAPGQAEGFGLCPVCEQRVMRVLVPVVLVRARVCLSAPGQDRWHCAGWVWFFVQVWVLAPEDEPSFPPAGTLLGGSPEFICYHFVSLGEGVPK